ncbi:CTD kinase subunit beta [Colletotrichum spaethianum]|uniref:RNA polymerase II holoenzyme cyclin-like subunit n=1 Tax=Colletotrichum spaethianum TaxID=700344 RepID=A0AA37P095_9PEZI|nr:CTD kinase subunit beta [Colletotrichum spaethianum]GKT45305.1 CTD kinase subunit beta [Colletotrichum spaethianum]
MTTLNGYSVPIETSATGSSGTKALDLCADGHPKLVQVLYQQDRSAVPPRLRLLVVAHPGWLTWSVHITGQVEWYTSDVATAPFTHPTATLTEIYLGVLEHWGREVSEATRRQIELLAPNHILDLPLDGDDVFFEDYSWFKIPVRLARYVIKDEGDEDDTNIDDGNDAQDDEAYSYPTGLFWDDDKNDDDKNDDDKTLYSNSEQTFDCEGDITMAPSGPKAQQNAAATNNSTPTPAAEPAALKGPHPGHIQVACQYTSEQRLRRMLRDNKSDPAREDNYRLQGVQLIDNVRTMLHVPIKTFDTACVYYHWFRLSFRDAEYNYQDAAVAALFLACKVEDTIKKSKEILCAAYNIKNPDHTTTQDDKMFEQPSKIIIGLERLVLETVGFDFRCRYPQSALLKATKKIMGAHSKKIFSTAMDMSVDLYKTFAPIKQTSYAMALGLLELTARILGEGVDKIEKINYADFHTTRQNVVETVLDLLDLYTQHGKSTKLGNRFDLNKFIEVKIIINNEVDNSPTLVRYAHWCNNCDGGEDENLSNGVSVLKNISFFGSNSAKRNGRNQDGTMRFVFDPEQARQERKEVEAYYRDEYEEYEVEVEVPMEPERQNHNNHNNHRDKRHDGGGGGWGGSNHHRRNRGKGRGYY